MHNNIKYYICPVCGYDKLDEPPYDEHGCSSFDICPCCGVEFGYDDFATPHSVLRDKWVENGMIWWSPNTPPPAQWDAETQLASISGQ